ncbi:hypothetical protein BN59_01545 [Legionella massiliensis]|uniref:Uncharacterized protein n=1 Tax=Legionella massiliensis TaxID=1034943 RepID=A0A078KZQ2_9GAMM|nr:hypothetical protein [Legionella massiliensis]CDZ77263.1 hypothetical protein BN59_01545 [Legionella massiliensis]CEE13001.1 hypothetical protein BN1094_01545 [Legionella massiliensis]
MINFYWTEEKRQQDLHAATQGKLPKEQGELFLQLIYRQRTLLSLIVQKFKKDPHDQVISALLNEYLFYYREQQQSLMAFGLYELKMFYLPDIPDTKPTSNQPALLANEMMDHQNQTKQFSENNLSQDKSEVINIEGEKITRDTFYKRECCLKDNPAQFTSQMELQQAEFREDRTASVGRQQITWVSESGFYKKTKTPPSFNVKSSRSRLSTVENFAPNQYHWFHKNVTSDLPNTPLTAMNLNNQSNNLLPHAPPTADKAQNISHTQKTIVCEEIELDFSEEIVKQLHDDPSLETLIQSFKSKAPSLSKIHSNADDVLQTTSKKQITPQYNNHSFFPSSRVISIPLQDFQLFLNSQIYILLDLIGNSPLKEHSDTLKALVKENNFCKVAVFCHDLLEQHKDNSLLLALRGEAYRRLNCFELAYKDLHQLLKQNGNLIYCPMILHQLNEQNENITAAKNSI